MPRVAIFALIVGLARGSEDEYSCLIQQGGRSKLGAGGAANGGANVQSEAVQASNSGPVYKTTTITFNNESFRDTMYTEICPKAASYMVECHRREVGGECEEYMKFESQAQFTQYTSNNYFWVSQALLDGFSSGAEMNGYLDLTAEEFAGRKAGATEIAAACGGEFPYPKPDNNNICYRDLGWATYLRLGYWGKDNCVCGDQICEKEPGAALAATQEPWRSWWTGSCTVTQCPF